MSNWLGVLKLKSFGRIFTVRIQKNRTWNMKGEGKMKNLKLSVKLYLVMGILVLTAVIIATIGYRGMLKTGERLAYVNNFNMTETTLVGELRFNCMDIVRLKERLHGGIRGRHQQDDCGRGKIC